MTGRTTYRIETDRLLIRCWSPEDAPRLRALIDASDQHLRPYIPWMADEPAPLANTAARLREYRARFDRDEDFRYAVLDKQGLTLLGEAGLYPRIGADALEIGYLMGASHLRQGYATEAAMAMVRAAFEIARVNRVEIHCDPGNEPSIGIPEKLGFTHEATLGRRLKLPSGDYADLMIWSLFAETYPATLSSNLVMRAYDCMDMPLL